MRADDEDAYIEYVGGRALSLRRTAYRLCGDWQLAEDLVQTALVKLFTRWRKARASSNLDAYTRQILVRTWLDEARRPWRRHTPVERVPDRADQHCDPTTRMALMAGLAAVPPRQRAVLVLRFWEGMSVAETADSLGCSQGTVKSQSAAGLTTLRRALPELADFATAAAARGGF